MNIFKFLLFIILVGKGGGYISGINRCLFLRREIEEKFE